MKLLLVVFYYVSLIGGIFSNECECDLSEWAIPLLEGDFQDPEARGLNSEELESLQETTSTLKAIIATNPELCYVGIKDGRIPNEAMTASSIWSTRLAAYMGRLADPNDRQPKFWLPAAGKSAEEWLQVDFEKEKRIVGIVTQGRPVYRKEWVTGYKILYGNSTKNLTSFQEKGEDFIFKGNYDQHSHVKNYFPEPVTARYFRLVVVTYHGASAVVRIEYTVC